MPNLSARSIRELLQAVLDGGVHDGDRAKHALVEGAVAAVSRHRGTEAADWLVCEPHREPSNLPEPVLKQIEAWAAETRGNVRLPGELHENLRDLAVEEHGGRRRAARDRTSRQRQGVFFTPEPIVQFIVERALGPSLERIPPGTFDEVASAAAGLRILDPAMGAGFFLSAAARTLARMLAAKVVEPKPEHASQFRGIAANCLYGVDINPEAAALARWAVAAECGLSRESSTVLMRNLVQGDALLGSSICTSKREYTLTDGTRVTELRDTELYDFHDYDAVIGNPPYESAARLPEADVYRRIYAESTRGKLNLYRYFIHRGLTALADKLSARLGYIVPSTLASDPSAGALREFIASRWQIEEAVRFREETGVFDGVTQAAVIVIFAPKTDRENASCRVRTITRGMTLEAAPAVVQPLSSITRREIHGHPWVFVRDHDEEAILNKIRDAGSSLAEAAGGKFHTGEVQLDLHAERLAPYAERGSHLPCGVLICGNDARRYELDRPALVFTPPLGTRVKPAHGARLAVRRTVNINSPRRVQAILVQGGPESPIYLENGFSWLAPARCGAGALLALLNSRLIDDWMRLISANNHVNAGQLNAIRIPVGPAWDRALEELETLGMERAGILGEKHPARCREIEERIDGIVYGIYGMDGTER